MFNQTILSEAVNTARAGFRSKHQAVFVSADHCYVTEPIVHRFRVPIACHQKLVAKVEQALRPHSSNAMAFGILPFCKSQQAEFIISEATQRYDKSALYDHVNGAHGSRTRPLPQLHSAHYRQPQRDYEAAVTKAKRLFSQQQLDKLVLGKQVDLSFDTAISPEPVLANLLSQSTSGYHFSFPTQSGAVLMGVSPELLLRKHGGKILSNPLAGSAKRSQCAATEAQTKQALMHSKKDRYEHAVVLAEMAGVLSPWCQQLTIPSTPSLLSTATMWHLSTEVQGQLSDPNTHILSLANRLHPTPALCGKPTAEAYPWVRSLEGCSRDFFSGIIGWCDKHGNGEWVVVIRSAEIMAHRARLFAGAGIVAASDPRSEWLETEAKLATMLNALEAKQAYQRLGKQQLVAS